MTKLQISLIVPFILLASCQQKHMQEADNNVTTEHIESIANDFFIALGSGDTTLMIKILADDFEMFEHDVIWNTDTLLSLMPNMLGRQWSIQDLRVSQSGNLIHVYYFNQGSIPADRSWYESMLMEQRGEALKIKFMHSTKLYLK